ncbi:MAG: hypothetical protein ACHQUB_03750 [Candidatus Saccharimonadia bacterium]
MTMHNLAHDLWLVLNSQMIIALVTGLVASVAIWIYKKQKNDFRRDAANVILLEVEGAEQQLQKITEFITSDPNTIPENLLLMPNASWEKYRHLFIREFDRNEWDKLSDFYEKCRRYDLAVSDNNSFFGKNTDELRINMHRILANYAKDAAESMVKPTADKSKVEMEYLALRSQFIEIISNTDFKHLYIYSPQKPINAAQAVLNSIESSMSLTSVGTKLKRLSKK